MEIRRPHALPRKVQLAIAAAAITALTFGVVQPATAEEEDPVPPPLASSEPLSPSEWAAISAEHGGGYAPGTTPQDTASTTPDGPHVVSVDESQQAQNLAADSYAAPLSGTGPPPDTTSAASTRPRPAPVYCRTTQDSPHQSRTTARVVNTHMRGQCPVRPIAHALSGTTYRSVWWGWMYEYSTHTNQAAADVRLNVPFRCHYGSLYTYRTEGRYHSSFASGYKGLTWRTTVGTARCR